MILLLAFFNWISALDGDDDLIDDYNELVKQIGGNDGDN